MKSLPLGQEDLRTMIENAGMRCTPQRLAVYDHLSQSDLHPTAEDVYQSVRSQIPKISLATVYKALEALVDVGVATKLTAGVGDTRSRYDARRDLHYHFRCLKSGAVHDLPTRFDPDLLRKLDPSLHEELGRQGFEVTGYRLELIGYQRSPSACAFDTSHPEQRQSADSSHADANPVARGPAKS
jgi:Fur family transcriptional regulator, peroxide stress response regulator